MLDISLYPRRDASGHYKYQLRLLRKLNVPCILQKAGKSRIIAPHPRYLVEKHYRPFAGINRVRKRVERLCPAVRLVLRPTCHVRQTLAEILQLALVGHLLVGRQAHYLDETTPGTAGEFLNKRRFADTTPAGHDRKRGTPLAPQRVKLFQMFFAAHELHAAILLVKIKVMA